MLKKRRRESFPETDLLPIGFGLLDELADSVDEGLKGGVMTVVTAFEGLDACGKLLVEDSALAKGHESPDNVHAHLNGLRTVENVRGHDSPMFGEDPGEVLAVASAPGF